MKPKIREKITQLLQQIQEITKEYSKWVEKVLDNMRELDNIIEIALKTEDIDLATQLQRVFSELNIIPSGLGPVTYKQMKQIEDMIKEDILGEEHGEEHKTTVKA